MSCSDEESISASSSSAGLKLSELGQKNLFSPHFLQDVEGIFHTRDINGMN